MRALLDRLTIVLFALALAAPTLDQLVRPDAARDCRQAERREPSPRPELSRRPGDWLLFPRRYEKHYQDTFGLRDRLLRWNAREQWFLLERSPSLLVARGREGWCFLTNENSRAIHRGLAPFTPAELERWVEFLRERQRALAAQGIAYLYVLAPNKQTIYPEQAPEDWAPLGPTRLDQLAERLATEPDAPFLDLRSILRAERVGDRPEDLLYTTLGSHWNGRGAYVVYRAILERLRARFPELELLEIDELEREPVVGVPESLAHQLYLEDRLVQGQYDFVRGGGAGYEVLKPSFEALGAELITRSSRPGPRLLWLHDSFGTSLASLVCASFPFVQAYFELDFPADAVDEARPGVVLETYVERVLSRPVRRGVVRAAATPEERFAASAAVLWRDLEAQEHAAQAFGSAELLRGANGLELRCGGVRDGLLLTELVLAPDHEALLRLELVAPEACEVDVYVAAAGSGNFRPGSHALLEFGPGREVGVVRLPEVGPRFDVLVRPHPPARKLIFRGLELRAGQRE
ncbi:MAG: hypothetical protein ABL998_14430 [Planctomycetota bacterium]